jgi:exo-1,4-beta-D-glucosaminidase
VTGSSVEWTVDAASAGTYDLVIRYANGTTTSRPMDFSVNGAGAAQGVAFDGTGAWATWAAKTVRVTLSAGANKIKAVATTSGGGPNVDKITV